MTKVAENFDYAPNSKIMYEDLEKAKQIEKQIRTEDLVIHKTTNYSLFKIVKNNRNVVESHVNDIMQSIKEKNMLSQFPIKVNKDMYVMDGQHRLEAARRLGLAIYYTISDKIGQEDIARINSTQKNWNLSDYLKYYLEHEESYKYSDYKEVAEFSERNNVSLNAAIGLLWGEGPSLNKEAKMLFKSGRFYVRDRKFAERIIEMRDDFFEYFSFADSSTFLGALSILYKNDFIDADRHKYDHNRMMKKIAYQSSSLHRQPSIEGYLQNLQTIYNNKERNTSPSNCPHFV